MVRLINKFPNILIYTLMTNMLFVLRVQMINKKYPNIKIHTNELTFGNV